MQSRQFSSEPPYLKCLFTHGDQANDIQPEESIVKMSSVIVSVGGSSVREQCFKVLATPE